jgi:hypothetical protein
MNEKLREIWGKIARSTVYHVSIGIAGATATAEIEDQKGITCKKKKDSLVFAHGKTKMQIPISEDIKIGEYPGGSAEIPDGLGIDIHSSDFRTEVMIEYSRRKAQNSNLKKK